MTNQTKPDNPFVGLRAFEEDEDYLFFGRSAEINDLLVKFARSRFLAVIGSSGSGKSSLVKSGLLPAIHGGFLSSGHNWHVALMRPENKPIENLALALSKKGVLNATGETADGISYQPIIESTLRRSTNGIIEVYNQSSIYDKNKSEQSENLLIIVDQFEELFRFSSQEKEISKGESQSLNFVNLLLTATADTQTEFPVYVLLTMRSDFLGDCSQFRGLPEVINNGQYLVPRMTRDEIKEAITGPIAIGGARITQSLITRLLNDVGNDIDQLPILQHAMMRTWDAWKKRNQPDDPINLDDYLSIGGMTRALSKHANEVYDKLSPEENKKYCEVMFKALTDKTADVRGTRRPRSINILSELAQAPPENIINIIEAFRKRGCTFLMPPYPAPLDTSTVIDISHESLMRVWDKLKIWTEDEAHNGEIYLRLSNSAELHKQDEKGLLKDPELERTLEWKKKNNPTAKWAEGYKGNFEQAMAYLDDSHKADISEKKLIADREAEDRRRKRRRVINAIIFLSLFALISSVLFIKSWFAEKYALKQQGIAVQKAEAARIAEDNANIQKGIAEQKAEAARIAEDNANIQKGIAEQKAEAARIAEGNANIQKGIAVENAEKARKAQDSAIYQKGIAVENAEKARKQNLKIAANEYARLIREGRSDENNNKTQFYDSSYFLAYRYHFDQLENFVAAEDKFAYESVKNKLYYNDELYQQVYKGFEDFKKNNKNKLLDSLIKTENIQKYDSSKLFGNNGARVILKKNEKGLYHTLNISNADNLPIANLGHEFVAITLSKNQSLIFCSTNDNLIDVFNSKLEKVSTIYMGAKVTALDFNEDRSIIYFGTASGHIGYIKYSKDNTKNQPIFENKLESEITAIQLFDYNDTQDKGKEKTFLLVAAKNSSPTVYKLDKPFEIPDKHLIGNKLPYIKKDYGDISYAEFNPKINRVILITSKGTYSWNPFTYSLLRILEINKSFDPIKEPTKTLVDKIKLY